MTVLVVEDTALVADLLVEQLQWAGCLVVGPAPRLKQRLALAATPDSATCPQSELTRATVVPPWSGADYARRRRAVNSNT
jgi:hypothetical protein